MAVAVDSAFPGGNIVVENIDGDTLRVRQDIRDTTEWWFYWNFRVAGAAGRTLRVEFSGFEQSPGPVGPLGPVVKPLDDPWRYAGGEFSERHFVFEVPAGVDRTQFAFCFPYQLSDLREFLARTSSHRSICSGEFAVSRGGRPTPKIVIGDCDRASRSVILSCRHHACEAMASYVLEGVMDQLLTPGMAGLLETTAFHIAPMMDIDGVEDGDQGKLRSPHDHNRDYTDAPLYPEVIAMESLVRELSVRGLTMVVDLHCPWIRNGNNESVFLVEPPPPWDSQMAAFGEILKRADTGPVVYTGTQNQKWGVGWNSGDGPTFGRFVQDRGGDRLMTAFVLEHAYSRNEGEPATPGNCRLFGRGLARALGEYLG